MLVEIKGFMSRLQTSVLPNYEWHSQNEDGNIGILVLQRVCENLSKISKNA